MSRISKSALQIEGGLLIFWKMPAHRIHWLTNAQPHIHTVHKGCVILPVNPNPTQVFICDINSPKVKVIFNLFLIDYVIKQKKANHHS